MRFRFEPGRSVGQMGQIPRYVLISIQQARGGLYICISSTTNMYLFIYTTNKQGARGSLQGKFCDPCQRTRIYPSIASLSKPLHNHPSLAPTHQPALPRLSRSLWRVVHRAVALFQFRYGLGAMQVFVMVSGTSWIRFRVRFRYGLVTYLYGFGPCFYRISVWDQISAHPPLGGCCVQDPVRIGRTDYHLCLGSPTRALTGAVIRLLGLLFWTRSN